MKQTTFCVNLMKIVVKYIYDLNLNEFLIIYILNHYIQIHHLNLDTLNSH